jgi:hypothetical protein
VTPTATDSFITVMNCPSVSVRGGVRVDQHGLSYRCRAIFLGVDRPEVAGNSVGRAIEPKRTYLVLEHRFESPEFVSAAREFQTVEHSAVISENDFIHHRYPALGVVVSVSAKQSRTAGNLGIVLVEKLEAFRAFEVSQSCHPQLRFLSESCLGNAIREHSHIYLGERLRILIRFGLYKETGALERTTGSPAGRVINAISPLRIVVILPRSIFARRRPREHRQKQQ